MNRQVAHVNPSFLYPSQTPQQATPAPQIPQPNNDAKLSVLEKSMASLATQVGQMTQMISSNAQAIKSLENIMSQMATHMNVREKGTFPSQTMEPPKPNQPVQNQGPSQVNAIHILRSGKEVNNQVVIPNQDPPVSKQSFSPFVDKAN